MTEHETLTEIRPLLDKVLSSMVTVTTFSLFLREREGVDRRECGRECERAVRER